MEKYRYVKVPFRLIPLAFKPNGLEKLVLYSIYSEALDISFDTENVAKRILYVYINGNSQKYGMPLPNVISKVLDDMEDECSFIGENSEYRGFTPCFGAPSFDPIDESNNSVIHRLNERFDKDENLWFHATMYYRLGNLFKLVGISTSLPYERLDQIFNLYCSSENGYKTTDWDKGHGSINLTIAVQLYLDEVKLQQEKDSISKREYSKALKDIFERKVMLAADMAMKSIKGRKAIGNATKSEILARMIGMRHISEEVDLDDPELDDDCKALYLKYSDKENFRRIIGRMRGSYFNRIEVFKGSEASGYFFTNSRDMTVDEFIDGASKIRDDKRKEKHKYCMRRYRQKNKSNTFKNNGLSLPKKKKQTIQQNIPFPMQDYQQPTVPFTSAPSQQMTPQAQPITSQQQLPFPPPQGYQQQPMQAQQQMIEAPPFPPFAK